MYLPIKTYRLDIIFSFKIFIFETKIDSSFIKIKKIKIELNFKVQKNVHVQ